MNSFERDTNMIEGMENYIGKRLKSEYIEVYKDQIEQEGSIMIKPDHYRSPNVCILMIISIDREYRISGFQGIKNYCYDRGMDSRLFDRPFSKKDITYLRKFVEIITADNVSGNNLDGYHYYYIECADLVSRAPVGSIYESEIYQPGHGWIRDIEQEISCRIVGYNPHAEPDWKEKGVKY